MKLKHKSENTNSYTIETNCGEPCHRNINSSSKAVSLAWASNTGPGSSRLGKHSCLFVGGLAL